MFSLFTLLALTLSSAVSGKYLRGPGQTKFVSTALVVAPSNALVEYKKYKYYPQMLQISNISAPSNRTEL